MQGQAKCRIPQALMEVEDLQVRGGVCKQAQQSDIIEYLDP